MMNLVFPNHKIGKYICSKAHAASRIMISGFRNYIIIMWLLFVVAVVISYFLPILGIDPIMGVIDWVNSCLDGGLAGLFILGIIAIIISWAFKPYKPLIKKILKNLH